MYLGAPPMLPMTGCATGGKPASFDGNLPHSRSMDLPLRFPYRPLNLPPSPPQSTPASPPHMKLEGQFDPSPKPDGNPRARLTTLLPASFTHKSRACSQLPTFSSLQLPSQVVLRLPSLKEFDQEVEAMGRLNGHAPLYSPPSSPLTNLHLGQLNSSRHSTRAAYSKYDYDGSGPYSMGHVSMPDSNSVASFPSPPPEAENRHINQKYTTEEGDFIIYAWHDKNLKWASIKEEFASRFGTEPERTIQGLQAWYYRMNAKIPVWDENGWLVFGNEDDAEPKSISIKCRDRDGQEKPLLSLGLAQRYPERAMNYAWVDPELKRKARDWACKRVLQYRERRDRRKRKEQRRL